MARFDPFWEGLEADSDALLEYGAASGAALLFEGTCLLLGTTPPVETVRQLAARLATEFGEDGVWHSDRLGLSDADFEAHEAIASGVMAISLSQVQPNFLFWFRPEVVQTVKWSGDPNKPVLPSAPGEKPRLHPRQSFEVWKETVRGRSLPWADYEIEAASELRSNIIEIVLRKAEEVAGLAAEVERINGELDSFSYSISHDLRAPFRHITGFSSLLRSRVGDTLDEKSRHYLDTVESAAQHAGLLVDKLLGFYDMRRAEMRCREVDSNRLVRSLVQEMREDLAAHEKNHRDIEWIIGELPAVVADPDMVRVVLRSYLSNALKFTTPRDAARIEISGEEAEREVIFHVHDNGVGFDMQYVGKLFGVFQRLHAQDAFPGVGIGLANARRLVLRHRGRTWAEGEVDKGATFSFAIPKASRRFAPHEPADEQGNSVVLR
jgi:light-regulated signal transduction histidine kinase (bacteriophytochrome)